MAQRYREQQAVGESRSNSLPTATNRCSSRNWSSLTGLAWWSISMSSAHLAALRRSPCGRRGGTRYDDWLCRLLARYTKL